MLAITRRCGQIIHIGDDITIQVLEGGKVRLGIAAPRGIKILRHEVIVGTEQADNDQQKHLDYLKRRAEIRAAGR